MDLIINLITLPFTIVGESIECLTSCVILFLLSACCVGTIAVLYTANIINF